MTLRGCASLLGILIALPLAGCNSLQTIQVIPGAGSQILSGVGQTAQYKAVATYQMGSAGPTTSDITNSVTWSTGSSAVATINSSGLATATGPGNTQIIAESDGKTATSDITVDVSSTSGSGSGGTPTLNVIPSPNVAAATRVGETTQFLAIGNLSGAGVVQDLTNRVRWVSSDVAVATIDQDGLATGVGNVTGANSTTITAIATTSTGAALTATSNLSMVSGGSGTLATLAIYKVGLGTGTVTSSAGGINCGPQASCTGNFTLGTTVTLTATPATGSSFGGWSANCITSPPNTAALTCTVPLSTNDSVGAIFNTP